jgi:hypothetical protein
MFNLLARISFALLAVYAAFYAIESFIREMMM